jgi:hypothetical protein
LGVIRVINDLRRTLANGDLKPALDSTGEENTKAAEVRDALEGLERQLADLEAVKAPAEQVARLREQLAALREQAQRTIALRPPPQGAISDVGADLPDLLNADAARASALMRRIDTARKQLSDAEALLARDAVRRLDLRLSRLLRRARLGRIETVLGRKRALQVEIEAIRLGYFPQDAVDSLDAARYLKETEEYWPFEGDDWPDEYVGTEVK